MKKMAWLLPAALWAQTVGERVVITIGEEKITAAELERTLSALPEQMQAAARGPNRRQFAESIVRMKLLAREARKRKLDETPAFQAQLEFQKDNLLAGMLYQDLAGSLKIEEAAARKYYDEHRGEYESVTGSHILVRMQGSAVPLKPDQKDLSEAEALAKAQQLRQRLAAGENFSALAKAESDDTGSAAAGGSLGTFRRGQMVAPFEQAAFAMAPGELSEPVKSQFGYHLIKVEAREAKTFDELRPDLEKKMRPELARQRIERIRKDAEVVLDEGYFGK